MPNTTTATVTMLRNHPNQYGITMLAGSTQTLDYDFARDLWQKGFCSIDTLGLFTRAQSATFLIDSTNKAYGIKNIPGVNDTVLSKSFGSALPFVMVASGNITSTSGNITTGTAFDYVIGPSYTYFPVGALFASSPAGWYYTNWTAATLGVVYADTYSNGVPAIPASPATLTTVVAAYSQVTGFDAVGPNYVIPGGFLGSNGFIEWGRVINNNNSAGVKTYNTYFGGSNFQGTTQTTNPKEAGMGSIRNRGIETRQIGVNAAHGDSGNASTLPKLTIDSRSDQIFSFALQLATATDYAIIEGHHVRANRVD